MFRWLTGLSLPPPCAVRGHTVEACPAAAWPPQPIDSWPAHGCAAKLWNAGGRKVKRWNRRERQSSWEVPLAVLLIMHAQSPTVIFTITVFFSISKTPCPSLTTRNTAASTIHSKNTPKIIFNCWRYSTGGIIFHGRNLHTRTKNTQYWVEPWTNLISYLQHILTKI